ncbi:MAG: VanZ family protein [Planctomycetota bacterium]
MDAKLAEGTHSVDASAESSSGFVHAFRVLGTVLVSQPRSLSWLAPVSWAGLIFLLSSGQPNLGGVDLGVLGGFLMNLAHPGVFGILTLLLVPVFARSTGPHGMRWTGLTSVGGIWLVAFVGMYGFTDELHQSVVEGRDASFLDLLSDVVGAYFVVRVVLYLGRPDATREGLSRWILAGLAASMAAAGIATWWGATMGEGPWFP